MIKKKVRQVVSVIFVIILVCSGIVACGKKKTDNLDDDKQKEPIGLEVEDEKEVDKNDNSDFEELTDGEKKNENKNDKVNSSNSNSENDNSNNEGNSSGNSSENSSENTLEETVEDSSDNFGMLF